MNLSSEEIRALNAEGHGWLAVPYGCPERIAIRIAEERAKRICYTPRAVSAASESDLSETTLAEFGI